MPEGPERDALTAALAKECYVPVYLDPKIVGTAFHLRAVPACLLGSGSRLCEERSLFFYLPMKPSMLKGTHEDLACRWTCITTAFATVFYGSSFIMSP